MADWKRPESVPYPSVWKTFKRKNKDGEEREFWIQDLTDEYKEDFVQRIGKEFIKDLNICQALNFIEDSTSVEEFLNLWSHLLGEKLGLICLTKNENGDVEIVGGNATARASQTETAVLPKLTGNSLRRMLSACRYVTKLKDIYTELNIDSYLSAGGLYVLPKFRGQGIAQEILEARRDLCSAVGIDVSATIFTSSISQKCAARAGFKDFAEVTYEELEKKNPDDWTFPGISKTAKALKYMYIDYRQTDTHK